MPHIPIEHQQDMNRIVQDNLVTLDQVMSICVNKQQLMQFAQKHTGPFILFMTRSMIGESTYLCVLCDVSNP